MLFVQCGLGRGKSASLRKILIVVRSKGRKECSVMGGNGKSRRRFLGQAGAGVVVAVVGTTNIEAENRQPSGPHFRVPDANLESGSNIAASDRPMILAGEKRADRAYEIRVKAAMTQRMKPLVTHVSNGDEFTHSNKIGNYSKGLPHNDIGEVDTIAYNRYYLNAIRTGYGEDFEKVPVDGRSRMTSPQSGLSYELAGADPINFTQPPPPAFSSAEIAAEIAENYWMALCRDINFNDYAQNALTTAAVSDLSRLSNFRGPRNIPYEYFLDSDELAAYPLRDKPPLDPNDHPLTTGVLFRGLTRGDMVGPYISQFLWRDIQYGSESISRKIRTAIPGDDYLTTFPEWLHAQRSMGYKPLANRHDPVRRYIRNGRDLGEWVHTDAVVQAYTNAALIMMELGIPEDDGNPYRSFKNQVGFATFGVPHLMNLLTMVAASALRAVWYQKWYVHRRTRPEEFAARIHNHLIKRAQYPIHSQILDAAAPREVFRKFGTYLLPMAYPEGSPTHPSYGSGHSVVAGACVTVLKAWYNEEWRIPNPVTVSSDGLSLVPYREGDLTIGGELNKLASNIALGRNFAGVHWRSDATASLRLGEEVAIQVMSDMRSCFNEVFSGFSLTTFDRRKVAI